MATIYICALGQHLDHSTVVDLLVLCVPLDQHGCHDYENDYVHGGDVGGDGRLMFLTLSTVILERLTTVSSYKPTLRRSRRHYTCIRLKLLHSAYMQWS
jgi:hypothetical protein